MNKKNVFLVGNALEFNAKRFPQKTCLIYKTKRFTYYELNCRINRLANRLLEGGINKGDAIGYVLYNCNEAIELLYACLKIGAIAVPLNTRLSAKELKWSINYTQSKLLFFSESLLDVIIEIKNELEYVENMVMVGGSSVDFANNFNHYCSEARIDEPGVKINSEDYALYKFTGGTTGQPKAAIHTQYNLMVTSIIAQLSSSYTDPNSTAIYQLPLFHMSGLIKTLSLLSAGGTVILLDSINPIEILDLIEKEKVTYAIVMPPQMWNRILEVPNINDRDLSSLKTIASSGGGSSMSVYKALFELLPNIELFYGWGQTETCVLGTGLIISKKMFESNDERLKSIGIEHPYLRIKIMDDYGNEMPDEEPGEAWVNFAGSFLGYFKNAEMTKQNLIGEWVRTGDIFYKKKGYYYMVDRKKDMIKTGGENVYCEDVESVLRTHPSIESAAVIGVPCKKFGEGILAVIQLRPGAEATEKQIIEYCSSRMASYKKPRAVVFVSEFPLSDVGKIQKYVLRERFKTFELSD